MIINNPILTQAISNLITHRGRVHGIGEDMKCELCDYTSKHSRDMNIHKKRMHFGNFYKCDQCDYKSREKINLTRHIAVKHQKIAFHCDQCTYTAGKKRFTHLLVHSVLYQINYRLNS